MIHYHGGPITPASVAYEVWRARHAFVSHVYPQQIQIAATVAQSFSLDNGAFSAWRAGEAIQDWTPFYQWAEQWLGHPACDWALIPDVIDGSEEDNDRLVAEWPLGKFKGVPVWHMHESLGRLVKLTTEWPRVAIGSSGEYATIGNQSWWKRMGDAMEVASGDDTRPRCKLHGLRMLDPSVFRYLPFASCDSTAVARNVGLDVHWKGPYLPKSKETRGRILCERVEEHNGCQAWDARTQRDWLDAYQEC